MTPTAPPPAARFAPLLPAIVAGSSFACADVLTKVTLHAQADVLTMALFRGFIGVPLLFAWLKVGTRPKPLTVRERWLSLGTGVLFAGNVFWLFKAIEAVAVPVAVLTYFAYPLLTGLAAAATGVDRLGLRGAAPALAAFLGLTLIVGAQPGGIVIAGVVFALLSACTRVVTLLITRVWLSDADPRLITFYSVATATALLGLIALASLHWQGPQTALGWAALVGSSIGTTVALLCVFISIMRIGPFRTALFMNLEPLLATIGSAILLGEVITPLQALGGVVMIAALVAFQMRR